MCNMVGGGIAGIVTNSFQGVAGTIGGGIDCYDSPSVPLTDEQKSKILAERKKASELYEKQKAIREVLVLAERIFLDSPFHYELNPSGAINLANDFYKASKAFAEVELAETVNSNG